MMAGTAHANSLSPYVYFWPGVVSITLVYAFPASLLASFLERPFLTAAGIRHRPLVLSLRANFLSTVVGILLVPIGYPALYMLGPLWCVIAFFVSCLVEFRYLRSKVEQAIAWGWVVGGNAVSSVVLMVLPPIAILIKQNHEQWARTLEPHEGWLHATSALVSVAAFLISFAWPMAGQSDTIAGPESVDEPLEPIAPRTDEDRSVVVVEASPCADHAESVSKGP